MRRHALVVPVLLAALAAASLAAALRAAVPPAAVRAADSPDASSAAPTSPAWHHPLYLARDGYWRGRVAVTIANHTGRDVAGDPVALAVGKAQGQADLVGARAEAIRVVTAGGTELLYGLTDAAGRPVRGGPVPEASVLTLPVEAAAGASVTYYIYFDNPTAWGVPDYLDAVPGPAGLAATASRPERMDLREAPEASAAPPPHRATVRVLNFSRTPVGPTLLASDLAPLAGRLRGPLDPASVAVSDGRQAVPHYVLGDTLLVAGQAPARTARTYYVSGTPRAAAEDRTAAGADARGAVAGAPDVAAYARLIESPHNLVQNASFEAGGDLPDAWAGDTAKPAKDAAATALVDGGLFGAKCVRIRVPAAAGNRWVGWHQSVPVRSGCTYVYASFIRCEGIKGGAVALHAHCLTAEGKMCATGAYQSVGQGLEGTCGWTLLAGTLTMPPDCATLGLHLTMNTSGTLWHDGVVLAEVVGAGPARLAPPPPMPKDEGLRAWPVNAVVKVFRDDAPPDAAEAAGTASGEAAPARLTAARNEAEPLQLAVRGPEDVQGVRIEVDPPVGPGGARLERVETGVVGYVPIDHATNYYRSESPAWHRKSPDHLGRCDGWPGWWPDPLLPGDTFAVEANQTQPVWVTFRVPEDAPAGDYRGAVRLVAGGKRLAQVPLAVHVWDFALPDASHVKAIYDVRLRDRWWRDDMGGDRAAYVRKFWAFLAERRVSPHRIEPDPVIQYKDGHVSADFTAYDEAAEYYFNVLGLPHTYTPSAFYGFGWGHPPKKAWGEAPYPGAFPYDDADRSRLRPEYKRAYQACLRAYWDHMKAKGWADRVVLYISDEPHDWRHEYVIRQMQALCAMIHEVDPKIPIYSSTWHHQPRWDGSLDVWGVGHQGRTPLETMRAVRSRGDRLWFTTDGEMCTDTPYAAVERLLPHYCFAHGAEAYEFWGADWLTYNPYAFGWHAYIRQSDRPGSEYYVRYPNGDGYLAYPGSPVGRAGPVSTVRLEQAREGVEDYEYLYLLRERIRKAKAAGRAQGDAAVAEAEKVLEAAAALVPIPNAGGRYSTKILPDPDAVFRLKERLGRAIEALGG